MDPEEIADHIIYIVVLGARGAGEYSLFQGFSANALEATDALKHICTLPPTITELFATRDEAIRWRASGLGGYAIIQIELEFLGALDKTLPWACFISNEQNLEAVERHVRGRGRPGWLHLTTAEPATTQSLYRFTRENMAAWSRAEVEELVRRKGKMPAEQRWRPYKPWPAERLPLAEWHHNITAPTETALRSLGFELSHPETPISGRTDDVFAAAISEGVNAIEAIRLRAFRNLRQVDMAPSLVVAAPSLYRHFKRGTMVRDASPAMRVAMRSVLSQQQYIAMRRSGAETSAVIGDPMARGVLQIRSEELGAFTAALCVTASSLAVPVIRCPPQIDRVREVLLRLGGVREDSQERAAERRSTIARKVGEVLRASLPGPLLAHIEDEKHRAIKLVGDTPLELLPIQGLPLSLARTTSRMPTLPGNLLMRHALCRTPLLLRAQEFGRVLVVRAFARHDPLRNVLEGAIQAFERYIQGRVQLQIVDVETREEFISAFNGFDGTIAIFDGHGRHGRDAPQGTLAIGSLQLNPFELYGRLRVPPIIILSACETHPLEGIENSVASAFLMMGARSVLGTMLPVDGLNAGVLVARFIYRLAEFVPALEATMPWTEIVAGMLRMSYVTDILRAFEQRLGLGGAAYRELHTAANLDINTFRPNWFERFVDRLAATVKLSEADTRALWLRTCYFTDTLRYVHLGQPEHIFVVPSERDARTSSESA